MPEVGGGEFVSFLPSIINQASCKDPWDWYIFSLIFMVVGNIPYMDGLGNGSICIRINFKCKSIDMYTCFRIYIST